MKAGTSRAARLWRAGLTAVASLAVLGAAQAQDITLTWWDYYGWNPNIDRETNALVQAYEAQNPNVTIQRTSFGFADFRTRLIQAAATGTFPDIAFVDQGDIPVFASQGLLQEITPHITSWDQAQLYYPNVTAGTVYQGKTYGVPFVTNSTVLFYNVDMFEEAGITEPPKTWDELRETAKQLTQGSRSGFCFSAVPTEEGTFTFLPFLWQAGGDVATLGDQASIDALTFIKQLLDDGSAPRSILSLAQNAISDQFVAGNCAMMVNGPWVLASVEASDINWAVANWPAGSKAAAPLGGESAVVGPNADVAAAWDVIRFISDPANLTGVQVRELGMLPNRTDQSDDERWVYSDTRKVFADQVMVALPRSVYGANYAQISEQIWTMVQKVLTGAATPEDAAKTAGDAIRPLLGA